MKFLFSRFSGFWGRISWGLVIKTLGTVAELLLPVILSYILDEVILRESVWEIVLFGALMIGCAACACIFNIIANRKAAAVSMEIARKLRRDLFDKTLRLSARDIDRFTVSSLESRITTDTYNVHNFIGMMQRMGVRAPILLVGGLAISFMMDSTLALVMLATFPLIFITVYLISRLGLPLYTRVQRSIDAMVGVVREDTQGIRVIKALSKNDYENRRFDTVNRKLSSDERRASMIMSSTHPIMTLFMNLGIAGVVALAAMRVNGGQSSTSTVIAFMQYFTTISMAMMALSRIFVMFTKCSASARRIAEVIETPERFEVIRDTDDLSGNHIEFKNVSFSYFGKRNNLSGISFALKRGQRLGIIGATGSGKTTLIRTLMRTYDIDSGDIRIEGKSIKSYTRAELSAKFGIAMQHDFLYADTIHENIDFARGLPEEAIHRAARIAQAEDFILAKEGGYAFTLAPKGTNLSGGQRQRLLIARAIAAEPDIVILDDSSSALDYKTDAALRRALSEGLSGSTVITVAQRVSSVKDCDLILVLEDGEIIGKGTHSELLESCPEYREISDSQMGGAFVE